MEVGDSNSECIWWLTARCMKDVEQAGPAEEEGSAYTDWFQALIRSSAVSERDKGLFFSCVIGANELKFLSICLHWEFHRYNILNASDIIGQNNVKWLCYF